MDLVSLGKEALQNIAEHAASYRLGQSALRQLDRGLWVVEKCARWAVPPPLDQDERPQPELVRPLPWVFFIMMLLTLRVARETVSLANLFMGKPPLRSADVVTFIQSKRRYIRALKYQGRRALRSSTQEQPWSTSIYSLFQLTMCFRRGSQYGNNNNTRTTQNDEVVVIKRKTRGRQEEVPATPSETTMERLIEKMMVDLQTESDEDSSCDLVNSGQKDISDLPESDLHNPPTPSKQNNEISQTNGDDIHFSPNKNENSSSTPEKEVDNTKIQEETKNIQEENVKEVEVKGETEETKVQEQSKENNVANEYQTENSDYFDAVQCTNVEDAAKESEKNKLNENISQTAYTGNSMYDNSSSVNQNSDNLSSANQNSVSSISINQKPDNSSSVNQNSENLKSVQNEATNQKCCEDPAMPPPAEKKELKPKEETQKFLKSETLPQIAQKTPKSHKIANGRTVKSVPSKKKGAARERRDSNEVPQQRVLPSNSSF